MKNKYYLIGGILSTIFYLAADLVGKFITSDYSFIVNAVSELTQNGANDMFLVRSLLFFSALSAILFWSGFLNMFKKNKFLRTGGTLLVIIGLLTVLTGTVLPMDPVGTPSTTTGIFHLILTGISAIVVLFLVPIIGIQLNKEMVWGSFKYYSLITVGIMLVFGGLSPIIIMKNIPMMGLFERINIYSYLLWVSVLSWRLMKSTN